MRPFTKLTAVAAPIEIANIDTDKIISARFLRKLRTETAGYDPYLFFDLRFDDDGRERPDFPLNQPPFRKAAILVTGANFGCGSSREGAVYALMDYGIRSVIAPSFGDIHFGNELQNGMLPVVLPEAICGSLRRQLRDRPGAKLTVDLESQSVVAPDGTTHRFEIDASAREKLMKGVDDVALILQYNRQIEDFEERHFRELPWIA